MNNKMKISIIIASIMLLLVGIYVGTKAGKKLNDSPNEIINKTNEYEIKLYDRQTLSSFQNKRDINVTFIDYYTLCNEEIKKNEIYYNTTKEEVKNIIASDYPEYMFYEEGENYLIFKKVIEENCKHHYIVKIIGEKIKILRVIKDNQQEMIKVLDTPINILDEEFITQLKKGINLNSEEELNNIIEDLES